MEKHAILLVMTFGASLAAHPKFIQFRDGNTILYDYTPDGTLLRKIYGAHKAEPLNVQSAINGEEESKNAISPTITPAIIYTGTTEYSGDIIYKDGKLHKVLFPGGYCTFDHKTNEPQFHYFTQDHLGNNRAVASESGEVEQITHYYPFGGTFGDAGLNPTLQQYKFNGKELCRIAGMNTYDFGARQYCPLVPWWDRMDKMCEKYYNVSPYVCCRSNPVNLIDKDGREICIPYKHQREQILNYINIYCHGMFDTDNRGYLKVKTPFVFGTSKSQLYQKRLIDAINEKNCVISIYLYDREFDGADGQPLDQ